MRLAIILSICLLEVKRIGQKIPLLGAEEILGNFWRKGKSNRLPEESMTQATQKGFCTAVV